MRKWMQWFSWVLAPLRNQAGIIPSTLTDDYGALLTHTLRSMEPAIANNITKHHRFLSYLEMQDRFRSVDGGERVQVPLMHAHNTTADIFSGYGQLDTTPQDGFTSAFYQWTQLAVSISISGLEERQNSGKARALNLLESKTNQAMVSIRELMNNCIVAGRITASADLGRFLARIGKLDTAANGPLPLAALIDSNNSRSVSIGNINGGTHSFWRNVATDSAATTFVGLKADFNKMFNDCSKGTGGPPDVMMGQQNTWETYFNSLASQERYFVTDQRVIDTLGGMKQDTLLKYRSAAFMWDEVVPDTKTNAELVDGIGTDTLGTVFFINSESMEWIFHPGANFTTTPMVRPINQDARVSQILWQGVFGVNNRRKNGVLMGISKSITS